MGFVFGTDVSKNGKREITSSKFLGIFPIIGIVLVIYLLQPISLQIEEREIGDIISLLTTLILISSFVERVIEVFLSAWRSADADELDRKLGAQNHNINKHLEHNPDTVGVTHTAEYKRLIVDFEDTKVLRTQYRAKSRFISQRLGLSIGIIISFVGVRILDSLFDSSSLSSEQLSIFLIVDVIFTGAVIAGGSDSINKVMKVFNGFMEQTAIRTKTS